MRTIYIDSEHKCHLEDDGTMRAMETPEFDGKCDTWIEGYCYDDSEGYAKVYPWKDFDELDIAQREYERQKLIEYEQSLAIMGVVFE